ncbi:protein-glucosylgalactosylhydroxylysine glucosidase isoform X2 [Hyla sarda]|uniref:protein-glucosylgalactosylhydroxylysine glucosidase isoform X2 n=1 Tax=Hyla sarda TaxID=327740 RepID=UPI0024C3ADC6|nr:protein-glucosylgalactosylhydroxylysine glucosidase isoform X2 [Hyla sarda]
MADVEEDPWIFSSKSLPSDPRLMATMANGYLGTRAYGEVLHVNGIYNGPVGDCHRANVPSPLNVSFSVTKEEIVDERFCLDVKTGTFSHTLQCSTFTATQQLFAHRSHRHLLVNIITLKGPGPVSVNLKVDFKAESQDLDLQRGPDYNHGKYIYGSTLTPEVPSCPLKTVHMIYTPVPQCLSLSTEQEKTWVFLAAVSETEDVKERYDEGRSLSEGGELVSSHTEAWAQLWEGSRIDVEGSSVLGQAVIGCLYYLLSSLPPLGCNEDFNGISPGGLSNGQHNEDYWGHVFWDQDIWIYPNILLFYPEMARHILRYRIRTLEGALQNAKQQGYKGAKFPWESAVTGYEVCPEEIYGDQEIHINGDVLMIFKQYYYMTKDIDFFASSGGWEVVSAIADYWCSRVVWSAEEQCYHIKGVMPPDEYHSDVINSVYTNALAQISLNFSIDLAKDLQQPIPDIWRDVASKIKVPFDPKNNYHPEYDGYKPGDQVKQADAVLLCYPLMFPMSQECRKNDLQIYETVTDPDGPAMTWSMFTIGYMEIKEPIMAQQQFMKCFSNITEPFKIWTENADGSGAVNFLTGMGGFLQTVLFGYTGFRITENSLRFDPILTGDVTALYITGVCYLGNKVNFTFSKDLTTVELTSVLDSQYSLVITFDDLTPCIPLYIGKPVSFTTKAGRVQMKIS